MGQSQLTPESIIDQDVSPNAGFQRLKLKQETKPFAINPTDWRVWDAMQTNLPGTAAADDLALVTGTLGTDAPTLQTSDAKATTVTQRACCLVQLPAEYVSGESITIRISGGMKTTISDGTATVDVEAYKLGGGLTVGSDLCTTTAKDINNAPVGTFSDVDFTITPTGLVAGDVLQIRATIAITDSASGTAVIGVIGKAELRCSVKG